MLLLLLTFWPKYLSGICRRKVKSAVGGGGGRDGGCCYVVVVIDHLAKVSLMLFSP